MSEVRERGTSPLADIARDPDKFARNIARLIEEAGKAASAYIKPREEAPEGFDYREEIVDIVRSLAAVGDYWLSEPERAAEAQRRLISGYFDLWASSMKRMWGEKETPPVAKPEPRDQRFKDAEWSDNPFFDFVKQFYLITTRWAEGLVRESRDLDPEIRHRAEFYVRQISAALSPSNFVFTNPELLRATIASNAENLVRGMKLLAEGIAAGGGDLRIRQTDLKTFEVGKNLAITPGKVIHQNELCQVIQYEATTPDVLKRPLVIVPPWINKFYILDLNPEKSFIRWCVEQGHTVFLISWVNPDERQADKSFEDYMREGILETLDVIEHATGESEVNALGYCVGGTLLAATLAWQKATGDNRIASATLLAAQVDFTKAGDLRVFVDEARIAALEKKMRETGFLDGRTMATTFNLLRPNDLIWPYVVNTYFLGKEPAPFDVLYWNSDATRMAAANHSFYLRNCYLHNRLSRGTMEVGGKHLDLRKITVPVFSLATREDHIAPSASVLLGNAKFGGPVTFVVAGSGHIAGVVNPPAIGKYQYWTAGDAPAAGIEDWLAKATEHPGSWWPFWRDWITRQDDRHVPARQIGGGTIKSIENAPGSYVKVRA
jgi:polyhydroxyalkanoate synthase